MSWVLVARQQLRVSWRRREIPAYVVGFALLFGALGAFYARVVAPDGRGPGAFLTLPVLLVVPVVPAVGLMLADDLVAGPREDGRLRLMLGQPVSRADVVIGGYVAKASVLVATLVGAGVAALLVSTLLGSGFPAGVLVRLLLLATGLGVAYLGIAVAADAMVRTTSASTAAKFALYVTSVIFWRFLPDGLAYATNGFEPVATSPPWTELVAGLFPSLAFEYLVGTFLEVADVLDGPTHYDHPLIYVGVLAWWGFVGPGLAVLWFDATDL